MTRWRLLRAVLGVGAVGAVAQFVGAGDKVWTLPAKTFGVAMTDVDWRKRLTLAQFTVLRKHQTEGLGSNRPGKEYRPGISQCAGRERALFSSDRKFDSGTGGPGFWAPLANAVGTTTDRFFLHLRPRPLEPEDA